MATVIPIRGVRYNKNKAGAIENLVTPPYDVIDGAAQQAFYHRSPYNIIRLEYGKTFAADNEQDNRYTRAAADFNSWLQQNIMHPEENPAIYLYRQSFGLGHQTLTRSGIICGVKVEPYDKGVVLPHEQTMPKHKADRLALMRACGANFSPVFGLYDDRQRRVDMLLEQAVQEKAPAIDFTDDFHQQHQMWVVDDPQLIRQVQALMEPQRILIADGHHRYETALNYAGQNPDQAGAGYVMMTLVNLHDPGLVILPTHRLIKHSSLDNTALQKQLPTYFDIQKIDSTDADMISQQLAQLADLNESAGTKKRQVLGIYLGPDQLYALTLQDPSVMHQNNPDQHSKAWRELDVTVLQKLILEKFLAIDGETVAKGEIIAYTRDTQEAMAEVDRGHYQMAFIMNPTLIAEVTQIAGHGEKMPQKSTFFYPKLITGLVINKF